jgi:ATP phosphoribosyltransferase
MSSKLVLALPSKGRLMENCASMLAEAGLAIAKSGSARGYKGAIADFPEVEINFRSSSEIAQLLKNGTAHLGITGEDLLREAIPDWEERVTLLKPCGFGYADVVVAVPAWWIDVRRMVDLEELAMSFQRRHGRRIRVATKYMNLTQRFFARHGVSSYRTVESLGATEGAPAAQLAELVVDITTTGATLRANDLRVLNDGVILRSQAHVVASNVARWSEHIRAIEREVLDALARAQRSTHALSSDRLAKILP